MTWFTGKKKPSGGYNRSQNYDHNPDDVCTVQTIFGTCTKCKKKGLARQITYWNGDILIRCENCDAANQFELDGEAYNDPRLHAPFRNDEDDQVKPDSNLPTWLGGSKHTKGKR